MQKLEELLIKDSEFAEKMDSIVLPFMKENLKDDYLKTEGGVSLHYQYIENADEMGTILISHGFCEFIPKYYEVMYYFYQLGYSVFAVDHRGHGYSTHQVEGFSKVHIDDFEDYVKDFYCFVKRVKEIHKSENYILFCHSMGGAVGARFIEEYPDEFNKVILSSPMIKMSVRGTNPLIVKVLVALSYLPFARKMYVPGFGDYDHSYKYPKCSSMSQARYDYQYKCREEDEHYQSNSATLGWTREGLKIYKKIIKNANLIKNTVILLQASEDTMVDNSGQDVLAALRPDIKFVKIKGSKHEIFNATDDIIREYYETIIDFLK